MSIENMELVSVLIYVLAGLFLLQSIFAVVMFFGLKGRLKKAEDKSIFISQRLAGQIRNLKALTGHLEQGIDKIPLLEKSFNKILDFASEKLQTADHYTESTLKKSTVQIEEIGRKVEFSLKHFNRQTSKVDRAIRNPALNASALLQGLVVGFKELFKSAQPNQPATHSPEDDAFI